ncbi:MAG: NgoBV family restriction endonuclease [Caldisericia bacterium]|nr:NgoBV family restriction endonuclease [Caldisericia bacterium]
MNATEIKNLLESTVLFNKGSIEFTLANIKTIIGDINIVGNVIQDWLKEFFNKNSIYYRIPSNTQEFPDFLLNTDSDKLDLLEVKCFTKSPNFDIANFSAYCRSLICNAYRLNSDYLIFEYSQCDNKMIEIQNIWLKKVWEICGSSERAPINLRWKQNQIYNIRPIRWFSDKNKNKPFKSRLEFINALESVLKQDSHYQKNWKRMVIDNYYSETGQEL